MSTITEYFETLRDWKKLPAYKAETRVDSIVGFALPQIFRHAQGLELVMVIPELPLRLGSVQPQHEGTNRANQSYKVDFFVVTKCGQSFLIEFKTDSGSRREGQDEYLRAAREVGLAEVLSGILRLYEKTTYKKKYSHLLTKLKHANLMMGSEFDFTPNVQSDELRILYIQPHKKEDDAGLEILDFEAVADALKAEFEEDEFMEAAAETFRGWAFD